MSKEVKIIDSKMGDGKSTWYEVNHSIATKKYKGLDNDISGIYKLYKDYKLVYIGKSKCIKSRIKEHLKTKEFNSFDFTLMSNKSDINLMEIYLIDKYKPILNKDCVEISISSLDIEELTFSNIINLEGDEV